MSLSPSELSEHLLGSSNDEKRRICSRILTDVQSHLGDRWDASVTAPFLIILLEQLDNLKGKDVIQWGIQLAPILIKLGHNKPDLQQRNSIAKQALDKQAEKQNKQKQSQEWNQRLDDERALIAKIKEGDKQAANDLYTRFYSSLKIQVFRIISDDDDAHDIVQSAFIIALENILSYTPGKTSIFFWLVVIARRLALEKIRRKRLHRDKRDDIATVTLDVFDNSYQNPEKVAEQSQQKSQLALALEQLQEEHPTYARIITLRDLEERSRQECAEILDMVPNTFSKNHTRALKMLRTIILEMEKQ